jgi:DNA polymerase III epsilon subunit-like protein
MTTVEPTDSKEERMIMVFDFETTGLPKDRNAKFTPGQSNSDDFPYAVQLAYMLYDRQTGSAKIVNEIVRLPEGVEMTTESETVHHISAESTRGKTAEGIHFHKEIEDILKEFIMDFRKADIVIAHNIHFDRNILLAEVDRLHKKGKEEFTEFLDEFYKNKIEYCTALKGKYVCKTEKLDRFGRMYYKMPKLVELYEFLFKMKPNESMLHNAIVDVVICFRCFYKMRYNIDIYTENPLLHSEIKDIIDALHKAPKPVLEPETETDNPEIAKIDKTIDQEEKTADSIVTSALLHRRSERLSEKPDVQYKTSRKNKDKKSKKRSRNSRAM